MKKTISFLVLLLLASFILQAQPPKAKFMVLGSYHMANPGADVFNMKADDVLSPKRQKEMEELVSRLAAFRPTKIVLEVSSDADSLYNARYRSYLRNNYNLTRNESEQIGFRLAKKLGHSSIYCVDEEGKFDFDRVMKFAMENGQAGELQQMMGMVEAYIEENSKRLARSSLREFFKEMNTPEIHEQGLDWYMKLLSIAGKKEFPGPELVGDLYVRNLKIMSNIFRLKEQENERILVIYGNGHSGFFKSILMGSSEFEWVNVYGYL